MRSFRCFNKELCKAQWQTKRCLTGDTVNEYFTKMSGWNAHCFRIGEVVRWREFVAPNVSEIKIGIYLSKQVFEVAKGAIKEKTALPQLIVVSFTRPILAHDCCCCLWGDEDGSDIFAAFGDQCNADCVVPMFSFLQGWCSVQSNSLRALLVFLSAPYNILAPTHPPTVIFHFFPHISSFKSNTTYTLHYSLFPATTTNNSYPIVIIAVPKWIGDIHR